AECAHRAGRSTLLQKTTAGLATYDAPGNHPEKYTATFTDGWQHWALSWYGNDLVSWTNVPVDATAIVSPSPDFTNVLALPGWTGYGDALELGDGWIQAWSMPGSSEM